MKPIHLPSSIQRLLLILHLGCILLITTPVKSRSFTDYLVPPVGSIDADYKKVLERKLFVTPADYGRVLFIFGGTDGEYAISIYSNRRSEKEASVTCTKAQRNIGDATWKLSPNRIGENAVKVKRTDMSIPKSAASSLSRALREMLRRTREREINPDAEAPVLGGMDMQFSTRDTTGRILDGLVTADMKGEHILALKRIASLLTQYCEASPDQRPALAKQLEVDAERLLVDLKGEHQNSH